MSKSIPILLLIMGLSTVLLLAGFTSEDVPSGDLPPRATLVPTSTPTTISPITTLPTTEGEQIQLRLGNDVDEIPTELWTTVEWQDTNTSDWHMVDGWQGNLDTPTTQTWWVDDGMFGDGPFRWHLYESEGANLLATSESFNLPTNVGLMVIVSVTLE